MATIYHALTVASGGPIVNSVLRHLEHPALPGIDLVAAALGVDRLPNRSNCNSRERE
jgi:hypothetical protein